MHKHEEEIELLRHHHVFNVDKKSVEKSTFIVVIITFITMIAEIIFGWLSNSMALLADGWHMGTHAFALGISLIAYIAARKFARDKSFTFGTWKIEILGAYTSAIVLGMVGLIMVYSSVERMINPLGIYYNQALLVAFIGLAVNALCAVILNNSGHSQEHEHGHKHSHEAGHASHEHHHKDLNLKSAYLHVVADALTSVLAIAALLGAKYFHLVWLDPFMGIVGAGLIIHWSFLLLKETSSILIQREMDSPIALNIKEIIESDGDTKVSDLHIWQVAQNKYACIVSLVTSKNNTVEDYKARLKNIHELTHVTVEIFECRVKPV
jgi:cation diffusion facilitator family transporter